MPRKKIRIRWYNHEAEFTKETKVSSFEGRFKTSERVNNLSLKDGFYNLNYIDPDYGLIEPVIKISYIRTYFQLQKLRVTFDKSITYLDTNFPEKGVFSDSENVVEIKVPSDCGDDYIQNIISNPTERFSKYCRGILMNQGQL